MPPTHATDAEFAMLVDSYYRPLYRFAMSLCGREGTAADLVQQTFYIWAEKSDQLRDRGRAKTWLFTTLHREFLQLVRRESRLVALPDGHEEAPDEHSSAPDPAVVAGFDARDLHAALAETPEVFRVPLALFYLEEFTYAEIAAMLAIPLGTVMSRLARGKDKLRERLLLHVGHPPSPAAPFRRTASPHG